jgi:hypothetical protein
MAGVISIPSVMLAELLLAGVLKPAASATKIIGSKICALVEVFPSIRVTTSSMVSTATVAPAPAARDISWYTSADSCDLLAQSLAGGVEYTLGRNPSANLDIRLLYYHTPLQSTATSSAIFCGQCPLTISLSKPRNGNHADACLVVTAVTRTKTNTPSGLQSLVV